MNYPLAIQATDEMQLMIARTMRRTMNLRTFQAAENSRLTSDWPSTPISIDQDTRIWNGIIRERARDLSKNNDYAKHFIRLNQVNVIGADGFTLQMNCGEYDVKQREFVTDEDANRLIEQRWKEWSEADQCSINGRLSFQGIQNLLITECARDGESLIRLVPQKKSDFGIKLQVLAAEVLDELYNVRLGNGHIVKMGVELDDWKRPITYYMRKYKPELELYGGLQYSYDYEPFSADEIIHGYEMDYENQTRGISWLVQTMWRLKMLTAYEEAALVNARTSAAKMGFFETLPGEAADYIGTDKTPQGDIISNAEPGSFEQLPTGMKFAPWDPKYPDAQHEMFTRATLRGMASGLGLSYPTFGNDLKEVNYSSIRAGLLVERDIWMMKQNWFVESFLKRIFVAWLSSSMMKGMIPLKDAFSNFRKYNRPVFIGRRWPWVDPLKDIEAIILSIQAGLDDPFTAAAREGKDLTEIYKKLQAAKNLARDYGLNLKLDEIKAVRPSSAVGDATGEGDNADGATPEDAAAERHANELIRRVRDLLSEPDVRQLLAIAGRNGNGKH
jgi:lambda family phage portal protein